jgi:hypothetical protein
MTLCSVSLAVVWEEKAGRRFLLGIVILSLETREAVQTLGTLDALGADLDKILVEFLHIAPDAAVQQVDIFREGGGTILFDQGRIFQPLDTTRIANVGVLVDRLIPLVKRGGKHGLLARSALAIAGVAVAIARGEIPKSTSAHKHVELVGHDVVPAIDNLEEEKGKIVAPHPLGIQQLDLVAFPTIVVGRRTRNAVHKMFRQSIVLRGEDHVIG